MTDFERFKQDFETVCDLVAKIGVELSRPTKGDKSLDPQVRAFYVGLIDGIAGSLVNLKDFVDAQLDSARTTPIFGGDDDVYDFGI